MPGNPNIRTIAITALASLLVGFALSTLAYRYRILHVPGGYFIERMNRELNLTPAERDQIHAIMSDTRHHVEDLRRESMEKRRALFSDSWNKIRAVLTPDQQKIFDRDFSPPWHHGMFWHGDHDQMHEHSPVTQN